MRLFNLIKIENKKNGYVAILAVILLLITMTAVALSLTDLALLQEKGFISTKQSSQAYLAAEAGIEDAILRIQNNIPFVNNYTLIINSQSQAVVDISPLIGGARTITSQGQSNDVFKKIRVVHSLDGDNIQFFFGAQVGEGGMSTGNGSQVIGNVFSNGDITGTGAVFGDVIISGNHLLQGVSVNKTATGGGNAQVFQCNNANLQSKLYYPPGGNPGNCLATEGIEVLAGPIIPEDLPISDSQISDWKAEALAGGVFNGNFVLSNNAVVSLGPLKIQGNLVFNNNVILNMTGTLWVTGSVQAGNNTTIQLADGAYGANSGVLINDGIVNLQNNTVVKGTNQPSSYLMLLTTNPANPAMTVSNNNDSGIFYASNGFISMNNNSAVREVTAYGLNLSNNVVVTYEVGLANLFFSSGPGSGWQVESWQEIE